MKKLMTLLSAAAAAFGLQAADFADTGTSFEGMAAGDLDITSSINELVADSSGYWETNGNEKVSLTVVDGTSIPHTISGTYPDQFDGEYQNQYLSIKTPFGNPAVRHINSNHNTKFFADGFYFDSLVKFTAFDEDPMTTAVTNDFDGAKIAVWLQEITENDVVISTNLYVRAGYLGGQGDPTAKTYDCGSFSKADAWHRLTIKAIPSIYAGGDTPGFVVFIDGSYVSATPKQGNYDTGIVEANVSDTYAEYFDNRGLFPSMVQSVTGYDSLRSVSFDGQGEVDDIVFTETAPDFAKDSEYVHIYWTPADITALTIDGDVLTSEEIAKGDYKVAFSDNLQVEVTATYVEGKVDGAWTTTGSATVSGDTFSFTAGDETGTIVAAAAVASFQGTSYASLEAAIAAAEEASATLPPPVLKLYSTSASDDIEIAPNALIVIDLNGQEIGGISTKDALQIIDSVGGGTVKGEVYLGEESVINAGTFDEMVTLGDGSVINGGRFIFDLNEGQVEEFAAEGYEFVAGSGDDEGYLVLVEKAEEVDFAVSAGANSYVSEVIVNGFDVTTAVTNGTLEAVSSNATWSVTFTANSGYEFEGGRTTTNFTGTAEAAVDLTGPDASSTSPSEPTIEPGYTSIDNVKASSEADATNKVVVASPNSTVVSDANYKKYFTLTAQETGTGVYTVSIALNEEAIELPVTLADVGGDLQDAAAAFGEASTASFTGISAKPGLYYWIETATDPAFTKNVAHSAVVFAEGDTVDLTAAKPENVGNAVFFRVCVDTKARVW